jgi:hypothetical protein
MFNVQAGGRDKRCWHKNLDADAGWKLTFDDERSLREAARGELFGVFCKA